MAYLKERTTSTISIYRPQPDGSNIEVQTVLITEDSKRVFSLMSEDYIELHFTLAEAVSFEVGDWVRDEIFGKFIITEKQMPTYDTATGGYEYFLKFEREYRKWKNWEFLLTATVTDSDGHVKRERKEADWHLTAKLKVHAEEVLNNLKVLQDSSDDGAIYVLDIRDSCKHKDEVKLISYSAMYILDALKAMADAYETEYWVTEDYEEDGTVADRVIHFGKCESGDATTFSLETNVESMSIQDDNQTFCNRLYAFGSTKNIPSSYRKKLTFKVAAEEGVTQESGANKIFLPDKEITSDMFGLSQISTIGFSLMRLRKNGINLTWYLSYTKESSSSDKVTYVGKTFVDNTSLFVSAGGTFGFTGAFYFQQQLSASAPAPSGTVLSIPVAVEVVIEQDDKVIDTIYHATETLSFDISQQISYWYSHKISFEDEEVKLPAGTYYVRLKATFQIPIVEASDGKEYSATWSYRQNIQNADISGTGLSEISSNSGSVITIADGSGAHTAVVTLPDGTQQTARFYVDEQTELQEMASRLIFIFDTLPNGFTVGSEFQLSFYDGTTDGLLINKIPLSWFASDYDNPSMVCSVGDNRLQLPVETGGYITAKESDGVTDKQLTRDQVVEMAVSFDEVYPRCVLVVTSVEELAKTTSEEYEDGSDTDWDWTQYKLTAKNINGNTFMFNKSFIKDGETLQIKFLTEMEEKDALGDDYVDHTGNGYRLAGMTFDVNFRNISQVYTIVCNEDYGAKLPNDTLKPMVGDPFILVGWDVRAMESLGLITKAEQNLQAKAEEYLEAIQQDQFTFACQMYSDFGKIDVPLYTKDAEAVYDKNDAQMFVKSAENYYTLLKEGSKAIVKHPALTEDKVSRVIGYEFKLDKPYDSPQYTIGETDAYSRIKTLEKEITKLG